MIIIVKVNSDQNPGYLLYYYPVIGIISHYKHPYYSTSTRTPLISRSLGDFFSTWLAGACVALAPDVPLGRSLEATKASHVPLLNFFFGLGRVESSEADFQRLFCLVFC